MTTPSSPTSPFTLVRATVARLRRLAGTTLRRLRAPTPTSGPAPTPTPTTERPAWHGAGIDPWTPLRPAGARHCNICRWSGDDFEGPAHCEAATCPRCGAIGRDRFLFWALQHRVAPAGDDRTLRVLETSPRLDQRYRRAMASWFDYLCSDYDERAHAGMIRIDLQAIDLPADSLDVIMTPHVLEHVPDTERALAELWRVLRPGGTVLLQVPLLQERTAPPTEPEFHGDQTPVFWRFGPDLGDALRRQGFAIELLATEPLVAAAAAAAAAPLAVRPAADTGEAAPAAGPARPWPLPVSPEFDAEGLLQGLRRPGPRPAEGRDPNAALRPELHVVADVASAVRYGFEPAYMFLTWVARKPARA